MRMGHPDRDDASEVLARCNTSRADGSLVIIVCLFAC
jgi:hypothetical protein